MAPRKTKSLLTDAREQRRLLAESSLEEFIKLVHPKRMLGNIHREVIQWWTRSDAKNYQLLLLPRDHMKSALIAYRVVWELTKDPTLRILYISSTSQLAIKQLKFMKDILTSDTYRLYWPLMVNREEAKRELWTQREIAVDHPLRKEHSIRDPSIFTAGLTTNIVGMHCDKDVLDDVVTAGNAYTKEGREKVQEQCSYLSSIEAVHACRWIVGTRYHPEDYYASALSMEVDEYDEIGNVCKSTPLFEVIEKPVESVGDGTGEFLWPRQQSSDGRWYGFDTKILSEKRSSYINKTHFRAQYYNDPRDVGSSIIKRDVFQYYDPNFLNQRDGNWYFRGNRLNVFAAIDFAYSMASKADYTALVVIGVDSYLNYYILEIDRFRAGIPSEYFQHILKSYEKWGFRKLRAEVSMAQMAIVRDLKESYIRKHGLGLAVEDFRPSRWQGSKEERILSTLEPKYANKQIWHYPSGNCQTLEEELIFANPAHDDIKDALTSAIDMSTAPLNLFKLKKDTSNDFKFHSRYGGVC